MAYIVRKKEKKGAPFSPSKDKRRMNVISCIIHTFTIASHKAAFSIVFE
ncbi:uncharacterized protein G2W53_030229 [Senna tora]|uniref:Uncharacterized protein n=1 Tax=Senna tora TaxID=362788 RepID=A0A834WAL1_9FABA|nr:uncharacterized protein G2W53_030229 [Senna tora]